MGASTVEKKRFSKQTVIWADTQCECLEKYRSLFSFPQKPVVTLIFPGTVEKTTPTDWEMTELSYIITALTGSSLASVKTLFNGLIKVEIVIQRVK